MMESDMEKGRPYQERPRTFSTVRSKSSIPLVFRMLMKINPRALIVLLLLVVCGVFYLGASTSPIIVFVFCICTLSLFFALYLTKWVLAKDEGPPEMSEISDAIRDGAEGFFRTQYGAISKMACILALVILFIYLFRTTTPQQEASGLGRTTSAYITVIAFLLGAICSGLAGFVGMWVSVRANVRVSSAARRSAREALQIAVRAGGFSAIVVVGMAVFGVALLYATFYVWLEVDSPGSMKVTDLPLLLVGYGFGASFVALFAQLGGGIYTKAADVGADLCGKVEQGIPEDDPRNPAVIADLVGDNVGDCAARGADLFESIAAEIISAMILGATMAQRCKIEDPSGFILFPLVVHSFDLVVSSVGILSIRGTRDSGLTSPIEDPMAIMQKGYSITILLAVVTFGVSTRWLLYTEQAPTAWLNFALCGLVGIITAYAFVWISKYYTDYKHEPVRLLALSSSTGHGTNIIAGVSLGMESTALPVLVISVAIISAFWLGRTSGLVDESGNPTGGLFGTAVATMGMLSTAAYVLTMDMFGPIADNAGGIVEMSQQPESVREITDILEPAPSLSLPSLPLSGTVPLYRQRAPMAHTVAAVAPLGFTKPNAVEPLQVTFAAIDVGPSGWKGDVLTVLVTEKDVRRSPTAAGSSTFENAVLRRLDGQLGGLLSEASAEEGFAGRSGQSVALRVQEQGFKRLGLVGLGRDFPSTAAACQSVGESVASIAKSARGATAAVVLASPGGIQEEFRPIAAAAIASGTVLGLYEDNRYRSESKKVHLNQVDLIGLGHGPEVNRRLELAGYVSSGVVFGKDLVNSPGNVLTPVVLAEEASRIASTYSDVFTATILNAEKCRELKMGSYLAVAAASANPPRFIHLCYKPPGGNIKRKLAIVGKGLTFDSGGYNIKIGPICSIELMKWDMGGSAAVFGAAKALGQIKPPGVEVHFIVAACENMISGTGMRPGDIVTASNGKTIEVDNTDAEGRLTLADALVYACKQGVDKIIDLATLTGYCRVALGPSIAGILTQSDELHEEVAAASEVSGEKFWRLPFEESYWDSMKSGVADMLNTGVPQGGVIAAALFLKQFVDDKVQWMHIDIAGPVWCHKKRSATGFGVSTMVEWVLKNSS